MCKFFFIMIKIFSKEDSRKKKKAFLMMYRLTFKACCIP